MSEPTPPLALAEARSQQARAQFLATISEVKQKLNPATLAQNAMGNVSDKVVRNTVETVRAKPGIVATMAGVATLFLFRKPIARLVRGDRQDAETTAPTTFET